MKHPFYQVDVFCADAQSPLTGNPLAVIFDAQGLTTEQMQTIARWTNLSETTFVTYKLDTPNEYSVRIFTPGGELPFAGHPSLGTAWAVATHYELFNNGLTDDDLADDGHSETIELTQQCALGPIRLALKHNDVSLQLPRATLTAISPAQQEQLALSLGATLTGPGIIVDLGPRWLTVPLQSGEALLAAKPVTALIDSLSRELGITGINAIGKYKVPDSTGAQLEVRSFAPSFGVIEDPVCGSGNGAAAYYLREHQHQKSDYIARQGRAISRNGRIKIAYKDDDIWLGGICINCVVGNLNMDGNTI